MDITIFIRTFNEAALIGRCLESIFSQQIEQSYEIIVLDSHSLDNTVEIAKEYPVTIYQIPKELFHFSSSLNFGVSKATGRFFVSLSAHAIPLDHSWLSELIAPLLKHEEVTLSYSCQIPWPECCELERESIYKAFPNEPHKFTYHDLASIQNNSVLPYDLINCSNVSACYRREWLVTHPFKSLPFSEDRLAALEIVKNRKGVVYSPGSIVYHSHRPDYAAFRKIARTATIARWLINQEVLGKDVIHKPSALTALFYGIKVPAYTVLLSLLLPWYLLRAKQGWKLRSASYLLSSLGTTLGKKEGIDRLRRAAREPLSLASCDRLIKEAVKVN